MCSADCEGPTALDVQRDIVHSCLNKNLEGMVGEPSISPKYAAGKNSSYTPVVNSKYRIEASKYS
jgi:hypothetical protein